MDIEQREAGYLAKAKDAQDKSECAKDDFVKEAWKRIADDYRALAKTTMGRTS